MGTTNWGFIALTLLLSQAASLPCAVALTVPSKIEGANLGSPLKEANTFRLDPRDGEKATVVVFLSSRCPCSQSHEGALADLAKAFIKEARFVGIHSNTDEPISESREHFQKASLPFPILQDEGAHLANDFGALKTPHVYVLSPKGEVIFQGGVDDSHDALRATKPYLRSALEAIRAGQEPKITLARSLGCVIRR